MRSLARCLPLLLIVGACGGDAELPAFAGVLHLVDLVRAPDGTPAPVTRHTIAGIGREAVTSEPGSTLSVTVVVPADGALRVAVSLTGRGNGNVAKVTVRRDGREETVWSTRIEDRRRWTSAVIDLAEHAGRSVDVALRAADPEGARVLWGSPVLTGRRDDRLDVLLYEIDTQRADLLEPFGFPGRSSPVMSALARRGVLFAECFSTSSWTRPSATSILTSLSVPAHGVIGETSALPADVETLVDALRAAGWYTVAFQTNPHAGRPAGLDEGFDEVYEMTALVEHRLRRRNEWKGSPTIGSTSASGTTELVAFLFGERLEAWDGLPLFLYVHTLDPHELYDPRRPFRDMPGFRHDGTGETWRTDREFYGRDVRAGDHFMGAILRTLERSGRAERMVAAFVSDHGEEFGDHGRRDHGYTLYDEQLRVPLLLVAPSVLPRGRVIRERVSTLDLLPTILDVVDAEPPPGLEGRSLLALAQGARPGTRFPDEPSFAHVVTKGTRLDAQAMEDPSIVGHLSMTQGPWKAILLEYGTRRKRRAMLYDLRSDPRETRDLSAIHPERLAEMRDAALAWWEARAGRTEPSRRVPDAASRERLRALGYVD